MVGLEMLSHATIEYALSSTSGWLQALQIAQGLYYWPAHSFTYLNLHQETFYTIILNSLILSIGDITIAYSPLYPSPAVPYRRFMESQAKNYFASLRNSGS